MSIKERLRLVIESQKLTVKDFAELVDTPLRTVHNYLNSGKEPSMEFLFEFLIFLLNIFLKFLKNLILI